MTARPKAKRLGGRSGAASTLTTLILVATTLTIVVAATSYAYTVLQLQSEVAEYENGKSALISLAEMIEGLTFARGSAAYTRIFIKSGGLELTKGNESLTIYVVGSAIYGPATVNLIKLRGGRYVGSPDYQILRGDSSSIAEKYLIVKPGTPRAPPLGWVYAKRDYGAWIITDFGRVRVVFSGTNNYTINGISWEPLNVVEVTYINLHFGQMSGSDVFDIRTRVTNVTSKVQRYPQTSVSIAVTRGTFTESYDMSVIMPSVYNGVTVKGTIVILSVVDVEVSLA